MYIYAYTCIPPPQMHALCCIIPEALQACLLQVPQGMFVRTYRASLLLLPCLLVDLLVGQVHTELGVLLDGLLVQQDRKGRKL